MMTIVTVKACNRCDLEKLLEQHPEFNRERQRLRRLGKVDPVGLQQRWEYYGNKCWVCRGVATATDHVKPRSKGGGNLLCNLRPICGLCNSRKGNTWSFSKAALIG